MTLAEWNSEAAEAVIIVGEALTVLRTLPSESVNCVATSPPYYGLRDYGLEPTVWGGDPSCEHQWREHVQPAANGIVNGAMQGETLSARSATRNPKMSAFCECGAWRGSLGLEPTPAMYVEHMVDVFREVRRVLRNDGTCWVNLGDSYNAAGRTSHGTRTGNKQATNRASHAGADMSRPSDQRLKPKDLIGVPWRVAFALQDDGWYLRSDIIWAKPSPMPESVRDRPTRAHEYIFLLTKRAKYWYDADAIRTPLAESTMNDPRSRQVDADAIDVLVSGKGRTHVGPARKTEEQCASGANARTVWTIPTKGYAKAHFATFPPEIPKRCILAGCPEGGVVLDPFAGSGTTLAVALELGRNAIGIELNPQYVELIRERMLGVTPGMVLV